MERVLIVFLSNIQTQWHLEEEMKFFRKSFILLLWIGGQRMALGKRKSEKGSEYDRNLQSQIFIFVLLRENVYGHNLWSF